MSKPAFIWRSHKEGDLYRRGDYDHVSVAVYTKRKPDPALGEGGVHDARTVIIPRRLGELLLILWRDSGPLIAGQGHPARLRKIAAVPGGDRG
jgi:hypothetical protein